MGVRVVTGQSYNCPICGTKLDESNNIIWLLSQINFGRLIETCPNCNKKCIMSNRQEFFTVTNDTKRRGLLISLISWEILIGIFSSGMLIEEKYKILYFSILIIFAIIHILIFNKRWKNAIEESIERLNNEEYILDLINNRILTEGTIKIFYSQGIVSEDIFNNVILKMKENNIK